MIKLQLFDYNKSKETDLLVTSFVNNNIKIMLDVLITLLDETEEIETFMEFFLPRAYVRHESKEARLLFDELLELINSSIMRPFIKPKYEYLLYSVLEWWEDLCDNKKDLLQYKLDILSLDKIKNEQEYLDETGDNIILEAVTNFEYYYTFCFYDHYFLPEAVEFLVATYLNDRPCFELFFSDVDLDDYLIIMPNDLRELYIEEKDKITKESKSIVMHKQISENQIINEISFCLASLEQRIVEIENRDENEISNDIYNGLLRLFTVAFELQCSREMPIGRAIKKLGETDIYIYQNTSNKRKDWCIIENKILEKFEDQYQQLIGYLNNNFEFGVTISINKNKSIEEAVTFIEKKLVSLKKSQEEFQIVEIKKHTIQPYIIKSRHNLPGSFKQTMMIYHFVLNLHDPERKKIARKARK